MKNIAIIPARGGSKRIPGKNIRDFFGRPIIAYSIEAALKSGLFSEVMVSTDDEKIGEVAKRYGAKVPFVRSAVNSGDFATTVDVLVEVLSWYKTQGSEFDNACCIYPTAPFVTSAHLTSGLQKLTSNAFDAVFPVVKYGYPIWRSLEMNGDSVRLIWKEHENKRSQDLPQAFHDAGQWYWFKVGRFLETKTVISGNAGAIELPENMVQDIDNETDWQMAELKMKLLATGQNDGRAV